MPKPNREKNKEIKLTPIQVIANLIPKRHSVSL